MGKLDAALLELFAAEAAPLLGELLLSARLAAAAHLRGQGGVDSPGDRSMQQAVSQARLLVQLAEHWRPLGFTLEDLPQVRDSPGRLRLCKAAHDVFALPEQSQTALRQFSFALWDVGRI